MSALSVSGVVIGQTAPERQKNGKITVCTALYSERYGLIRIYPVPWQLRTPLWSEVECEIEKNPKDSRKESWKVVGDETLSGGQFASQHFRVGEKRKYSSEEKYRILSSLSYQCVHDLNDDYISIGVIHPLKSSISVKWKSRDATLDKEAFDLDSLVNPNSLITKTDLPILPYVTFVCPKCRNKQPHEMSLLDKEIIATWLATGDKKSLLARIYSDYLVADKLDWRAYLVIGNSVRYRKSFMVGNVIRFKHDGAILHQPYQGSLFMPEITA